MRDKDTQLIWEAFWDEETYWQDGDVKVTIKDVLEIADEPIQVDPNDLKHLLIPTTRIQARVDAADLKHPIVVTMRNREYKEILDGQHRLVKALARSKHLARPRISVRVLNLDEAPEEYQQLFK
jgi:hypothetical protein